MNARHFMTDVVIPRETRRKLVFTRTLLVSGEAIAVLLAQTFDIHLPLVPMLSIVTLHGLFNLLAYLQSRREDGHAAGVFLELAADGAVITALVYFSGGYANPFISLLLLPLILGAVTVPAVYAWAMTVWVAVLYSILARYYHPLALMVDSGRAIDLHLAGMWLNFLFTALLVAAFVARLSSALRQREEELARAREKALRDEQLFALGMQAAAAAHDLATPLSALSLSVGELERDYDGDDELSQPLAAIRGQTERMKVALKRLAAAAGAAHQGEGATRPLDEWIRDLFSNWSLMWPGVTARLNIRASHSNTQVREDATLVSVIATLLNNGARVSPEVLELEADWDDEQLTLRVLDRGPGMAPDPNDPGGWGVGLTLARAALERFHGRLEMEPRGGGGMAATVTLPLSALRVMPV